MLENRQYEAAVNQLREMYNETMMWEHNISIKSVLRLLDGPRALTYVWYGTALLELWKQHNAQVGDVETNPGPPSMRLRERGPP